MYGMGFDGDDDALDVLAAAAGAPAPAAARAAAGDAPVQAHGHAVHEFALYHVWGGRQPVAVARMSGGAMMMACVRAKLRPGLWA